MRWSTIKGVHLICNIDDEISGKPVSPRVMNSKVCLSRLQSLFVENCRLKIDRGARKLIIHDPKNNDNAIRFVRIIEKTFMRK